MLFFKVKNVMLLNCVERYGIDVDGQRAYDLMNLEISEE